MVVRTRLRAILTPLVLYLVSGAISAYFIHTALNGARGLHTREDYQQQMAALRADLERLQAERAQWLHRVTLMRPEAVDRDLAEEQARLRLDYVDPHDLVIFLDRQPKP